MRKDPLIIRLHFQPCLTELARYISYGGRREKDVKEKCDELRARFGDQKVMWALVELTMKDEKTGLTVLRADVRPICRQLLGPMPESPEYAAYWEANHRTPPLEHQPPGPEAPEGETPPTPKAKRSRKR